MEGWSMIGPSPAGSYLGSPQTLPTVWRGKAIAPLVCRVGGNDEHSAKSRPEVYRSHGLLGDDSFQDAEGRIDPACEVGIRLVLAVFYGVGTGPADFAEDTLLEKVSGAV